MYHAYFFAGEREEGVAAALAFGERALGLSSTGNPDVLIERHGLFTVDDARRISVKAELSPLVGDKKLYIIAANRLFHEAQNAMLKLFEEPPAETTLVLVIPSEGNLLYTLRSRLQPLPVSTQVQAIDPLSQEFIGGSTTVREKVVANILDEAKSDDDEKKQEARAKALRLAEGLTRAGYGAWRTIKEDSAEAGTLRSFLYDLDRLVPVLHDRAAPLKPILEHLLLTAPKKLS